MNSLTRMHSFSYDRFQEEAIGAIRQGISTFVSAPTGAGKTVIAEVAVEEALRVAGGMAIYTAPIKALSNQKFRDFHAIYGDRVGILTGDVTLNPDAPLLIMTTEIYRNSLFEGGGRFAKCRWVIFDEVHFLGDHERGTVWEEALLLTPRSTEILALSATIPNAQELARWIEQIHGRQVKVVIETHRPVPLKFTFQSQDEICHTLEELKTRGYQNQEVWRPKPRQRQRQRRWRPPPGAFRRRGGGGFEAPTARPNRADHLMREIRRENRLPCLYFCFNRKRTAELAWEFAALGFLPPEERPALVAEFDRLCEKYQIGHEKSAAEMRELVGQGIAYHHAGLLPTLKEVVEIMFGKKLLRAIVTTETFALGVNMPARAVVLDTLVKKSDGPSGVHRSALRVRDLSQMAGRAGRRGMDEAGFVYLRVNPWEIRYPEVVRLTQALPEQVLSRFNLSYATLLNLYVLHGKNLLPFYQRTFHCFQASQAIQKEAYGFVERRLALLEKLGYLYPMKEGEARGKLTAKGTFASELYGYELVLSELFSGGWIDQLDQTELAVFLLALVYEPRNLRFAPKTPKRFRSLEKEAFSIVEAIHREEKRFRVGPMSKPPAFNLAAAMEKWISGADFNRVVDAIEMDEGELIRYFRMTVQLARALAAAPSATAALRDKALRIFQQINRDPVDAEAELRRSL